MLNCDQILKDAAKTHGWNDAQTYEFLDQTRRFKDQLEAQNNGATSFEDLRNAVSEWARKEVIAAIQQKIGAQREINSSVLHEHGSSDTLYQSKLADGNTPEWQRKLDAEVEAWGKKIDALTAKPREQTLMLK